MSRINDPRPRAVADLGEGFILASVEVAASAERVFRALASNEITQWWVRPGVFDTREWTGDVRAGGRWRASGMTRGEPYVQEGEFLERRLGDAGPEQPFRDRHTPAKAWQRRQCFGTELKPRPAAIVTRSASEPAFILRMT
jgi:Activator of Hsp90 ATPase homolog 1-like protein